MNDTDTAGAVSGDPATADPAIAAPTAEPATDPSPRADAPAEEPAERAGPSRRDIAMARLATIRGSAATAKRQNDLARLADAVCDLVDLLIQD